MCAWLIPLFMHLANADSLEEMDKIESTRASISEDERRQREALRNLFVINKTIRTIAHRQETLNKKLATQEVEVRTLVQGLQQLETRAEQQKGLLNHRLRQLYQERNNDDFHWIFSGVSSPVELERNHRFLRLMIDSDHQQLNTYLLNLKELQAKRAQLKGSVVRLASLQKQAQSQEKQLSQQLREKSSLLANLKKSKDLKMSQLKSLRENNSKLNDLFEYAFFERKGALRSPMDATVVREFGTYVDPQFHFRVMHKGMYFAAEKPSEVHAISQGRVVFANRMPGLGKAVIVDHGDNYYSVYAFASQLKVREGDRIQEGALVALSGGGSPLFGPGLYFEIRHFTDAIDPRPWIKDSVMKAQWPPSAAN